jgi:nifR3 family TIM-barrel protein
MEILNWQKWPRPILALAPMDGWTDSALRTLIKELAEPLIVYTEFVSVDGLTHKSRSQQLLAKAISHREIEKPLVVQLFGKDPEKFALAAKLVEELGAGAIDINFGCPARKVVNSENGGALLCDPELALKIVEQTIMATSLPVSVKTRLGWSDPGQILKLAPRFFELEIAALTLHGRTVKQAFAGKADLTNVYKLKEQFPKQIIIGNGDIVSADQALEVLEKLDGIMIGREAMRRPWIFAKILAKLQGQDFQDPSFAEQAQMQIKHAKLKKQNKGSKGIVEMRKFLASMVRGFEGAAEMRQKLMQIQSLGEIEEVLSEITN